MNPTAPVVALSGGIGGAKLALGLARQLAGDRLCVVANTGDDFEHLGLSVSPDIDTLVYTLAGINNPDAGWGRAAETWSFMSALEEIGAPTWFQLGDKDLALNVYRTEALRRGVTLSEFTAGVARAFGISSRIVPMSDDSVRTLIETNAGTLAFQDYFVREKCRPVVERIRYRGVERARPSPGFQALLDDRDVAAYVLCPSNPYLSMDPILSLPGVHEGIAASPAPVVAVSPIVGGQSLKGPTGKIMAELGKPCTVSEVASHYRGVIDGLVIDEQDAGLAAGIRRMGIEVVTAGIVMRSEQDKVDLAGIALSFAENLAARRAVKD